MIMLYYYKKISFYMYLKLFHINLEVIHLYFFHLCQNNLLVLGNFSKLVLLYEYCYIF